MAAGGMSVKPLVGAERWRQVAGQRAVAQVAAPRRHADSPVAFWALMVFMGILVLAPQAISPALAPPSASSSWTWALR
jgi:hypothetical protein